MTTAPTSYPRTKIKILLLENISDAAVRELEGSGYAEIERLGGALTETELVEAVKGVHLLGIRSKTKITNNVIAAADKLLAIGAFCIGVNQVDLKAATEKGIAVFNAPYSICGRVGNRPLRRADPEDRRQERSRA
jgi:D-3-phosphoglycerate dehydrogenase